MWSTSPRPRACTETACLLWSSPPAGPNGELPTFAKASSASQAALFVTLLVSLVVLTAQRPNPVAARSKPASEWGGEVDLSDLERVERGWR